MARYVFRPTHASGSPFEASICFSRAVRIGEAVQPGLGGAVDNG